MSDAGFRGFADGEDKHVLIRTITYATLFIGFVLVYVPGLLLGSVPARPAVAPPLLQREPLTATHCCIRRAIRYRRVRPGFPRCTRRLGRGGPSSISLSICRA